MLLLLMICSTYIPWLTRVTVITVTIMYRPTNNNIIYYYYYNNLAKSKSMTLIIKNSMLLVPKLKVFFAIFFYIQYSDTKLILLMLNDWTPKNKWVWSYFVLVRRSAILNVQSKSLNEKATGTRFFLYFLNIQYTVGQHNHDNRNDR